MTIITQLPQVLGNNRLTVNNNTVTVSSNLASGQNAMSVGSYFKLSPMSASGANTSIGTWA